MKANVRKTASLILSPPERSWTPILMYHRVVPRLEEPDPWHLCVSTTAFEAQMNFLNTHGYHPLSLSEVFNRNCQPCQPVGNPVIITFDDGYVDVYQHAFPILQKYQFPATVFLVSDSIGKGNHWDHGKLPTFPLLTADQVFEMKRWGISVGSHSTTHSSLPSLDPGEAWREIWESQERLQQLLGTEVNTFSYPYGRSTPFIQEMVRGAGYIAACGIEQREHSRFNLSRIDVSRCSVSFLVWRWKLSGASFRLHRILHSSRRMKLRPPLSAKKHATWRENSQGGLWS